MVQLKHVFASLALVAALIWAAVLAWPDNKLHLVFCDVGQGDAILITRGFKQVLIDGGPDERVLECLADHLPFWDRTIELAVLTHTQADHLTGLIGVLERYQVKHFMINNLAHDTERFWRFREALLAEEAAIHSPQAGERIKINGLELAILWPQEKLGSPLVWQKIHPRGGKDTPGVTQRGSPGVKGEIGERKSILGAATFAGNINESSVVLKLSYGHFDALLTGDIGFETEKQLQPDPVEVLKVAHHGSKSSTSEAFLNHLQPALAVISVGKNSFGHPAPEVLDRLTTAGVKILRTDQTGEIVIVSDGERWKFYPSSL